MVEHYRVNTYLGDYGAGRTVKTFSLLPGEKTVISVQTYKQTISNKKAIENVLDSFSQESAEDLEQIVESETQSNDLDSTLKVRAWKVSGGVNVTTEKVGAEIDGSFSNSKTTNSSRSTALRQLNSAISKQTQKSSNNRSIEVNTEIGVTSTTSEATSIVRNLENINKSRTLNFVFRQLNQELITITYLDDVSFVFTNGYDEVKKVVKLDGLRDMLIQVLTNAPDADTIFGQVINQLASVYDSTGTRQSFVDKFTESIQNAETSAEEFSSTYWRKDPALSQTAENISVNGIIKNVTKRILPTDSVIVDALLGQGEALDCYNMRLQDIDALASTLENDKTQLGLDIVNEQTTPTEKADKYKVIFGDCCDAAPTV